MTAYYTQAQIDEIGALIGQEILNSNEALKQFVQDKIAALEPVTPPAPTEPEAGDGTTPAPAAGMFLDDGREIKTKLITGILTDSGVTVVPTGVSANKILNASVNFFIKDFNDFVEAKRGNRGDSAYFDYSARVTEVRIANIATNSALLNSEYRILITYLA